MDFLDRLTGRRWETVQPASFLKFTNLDERVQKHLQRVYATLAVALAISALGCFTDIIFRFSGLITYIVALGCMFGLSATAPTAQNLHKRYAMLGAFSFCQGASLSPLVNAAIVLHPGVLLTAFMGTAAIFLCFSVAALLTKRRSYLYLGGWLASAISSFMVMRLASWMFGGRALVFQAELYLGLIVFAGYVLFDTQIIVEKAYAGYTDHVKHALDLLVDVLAIFVRILVILMKNADKKQQQERNKKRR